MLFRELYSSNNGNQPNGKIDVPAVGLLIGEIASWRLTLREVDDGSKPTHPYVLRAQLSHVNRWMFDDPSLQHRIVIEIGRGKHYRLEAADDARTVLDGLSLVIEGVKLCHLEA